MSASLRFASQTYRSSGAVFPLGLDCLKDFVGCLEREREAPSTVSFSGSYIHWAAVEVVSVGRSELSMSMSWLLSGDDEDKVDLDLGFEGFRFLFEGSSSSESSGTTKSSSSVAVRLEHIKHISK